MNNAKIYARQIPPEYQESPLNAWEEYPENIAVFGNNRYSERYTGVFDGLPAALESVAEMWDDLQNGAAWCRNGCLSALLWSELPRECGVSYTRPERLELVRAANEYTDTGRPEYLARAAEIVAGQAYKTDQIYGSLQSSWQNVLYPAEYGPDWLEAFAAEYFNTGTEWVVHDAVSAPTDPADIDGYSVYCHTTTPRAELATAIGCAAADLVLWEFAGWERRAKYMEV